MPSTVSVEARAYTDGSQNFIRRGSLNLGVYATNGVAITPSQFGFAALEFLSLTQPGGYVFEWDKANSKIKAYRNKDPAAGGGADIPLPEVANAVDITAVVARFEATGTFA